MVEDLMEFQRESMVKKKPYSYVKQEFGHPQLWKEMQKKKYGKWIEGDQVFPIEFLWSHEQMTSSI